MAMDEIIKEEDLTTLVESIKNITRGDFSYVKEGDFSDPEIAKVLNKLMDSFMYRNNKYLVRLNESMFRIADNSCVKVMLDEIDSQEDSIKALKSVKGEFNESITDTGESGSKVFALTKQVLHSLEDYALQCRKALYIVNVMLDRGGLDMEQENSLIELSNNLKYQDEGMTECAEKLKDMAAEMNLMFEALGLRAEHYQTLFGAIDSITHSYEDLFTDCISVGDHLYRISRDIDNIRNDMFRKNSWPLLHDKLKVFTADHLTLSWRLYNHVIEYETLKIEQVNNPDGCKFGLWANGEMERNSEISKSEAFKDAVNAHNEFHEHAISCFLLKESFKSKEALAEFQAALEVNTRFANAMSRLHKFINSLGILDETEIKGYN